MKILKKNPLCLNPSRKIKISFLIISDLREKRMPFQLRVVLHLISTEIVLLVYDTVFVVHTVLFVSVLFFHRPHMFATNRDCGEDAVCPADFGRLGDVV